MFFAKERRYIRSKCIDKALAKILRVFNGIQVLVELEVAMYLHGLGQTIKYHLLLTFAKPYACKRTQQDLRTLEVRLRDVKAFHDGLAWNRFYLDLNVMKLRFTDQLIEIQ
jgi:hypothetical protein